MFSVDNITGSIKKAQRQDVLPTRREYMLQEQYEAM